MDERIEAWLRPHDWLDFTRGFVLAFVVIKFFDWIFSVV
jgi:hypothetical protein